jgi:histidinol phosphatase-like PHP family hydrolase
MKTLPVVDYHVHLTDTFTIDRAVALATSRNIKFGIVSHPGPYYGIETDADLRAYVDRLHPFPVYAGLQPVHLGWAEAFSAEAIQQLDYVLMDADTVPLDDGSYLEIWRHDLFIEDMDAFMDRYMNHIMQILTGEPIQIFGRPTFLPINFARHHDELWTQDRVMQIIDAARERDIALEIQENIRIPTPEFVTLAKKAGIKFTFGTNARDHNAGNFKYCLETAQACGLTEDDMFFVS